MKMHSRRFAARLGGCVMVAGLGALPLAAAATHGGDLTRPTFHIGAGAGTNSINGSDYTGNGNDVSDSQVSYKGLAGLRLNDIVSLEVQYLDFGTARDDNNTVKAHGVTAGGVFEAPLSRYLHPYAKAGALFWDSDGEFNGINRNDTGTDFTYGAGVRALLGSHLDIRAEYERFELDRDDVHTVSAMLQFNF